MDCYCLTIARVWPASWHPPPKDNAVQALDEQADAIAIEVLSSHVVALQGLPRSGRSSLLRRVGVSCGATGLFVNGRLVSESNHRSEADRIGDELSAIVHAHGAAQLIIDDFGTVMRSTFGHVFQAAMRSIVVDGEMSQAVGCLVSACLTDPIRARGRRGSPLLAVARYWHPGWLDLEGSESSPPRQAISSDLLRACGSNVALIDRLRTGSEAAARSYVSANLDRWLTDLNPEDLDLLSDAVVPGMPYRPGHDRLAPLLWRENGSVGLAELLPRDRVVALLLGPWPSTLPNSASRFAGRIGREPSPLWIDRYILKHPSELGAFLRGVSALANPSELRLLTTRYGSSEMSASARRALRTTLVPVAHAGLQVSIREAAQRDISALHARQLLLPTLGTAFQLPPEDRILGVTPVGNESDAVLSFPDWALAEAAWGRARPLLL